MQVMDYAVIEVPVDDVLERLDGGKNWIQGAWGDPDSGMCLHQGIRVCQKQAGDAFLIEQVAGRFGWGTEFNDAEGTTFDVVRQRLVEHREVFPDELEATFGPQWNAVVGLVRRAAVLTESEANQLAVAWDAAGDAARAAAAAGAAAAAWAAARAAAVAGAAARDAARAAAGAVAWAAAWAAARDAGQALVVRDMIAEHGLTQQHYDTLTGPWAQIIGPVHPNDFKVT